MGADIYSENVLIEGQVISRPEWPGKNAQWWPDAIWQTVGHLPGQYSCCFHGRVGLAKQQGKRVAHRLSKWPTDVEIDGTARKSAVLLYCKCMLMRWDTIMP